MKRIYISGQITGIEEEAKKLFKKAEEILEKQGFQVINPMELTTCNPSYEWIDYMRYDIKALVDCDTIYMLKNWTKSKGAKIERRLAIDLGLKVIYE